MLAGRVALTGLKSGGSFFFRWAADAVMGSVHPRRLRAPVEGAGCTLKPARVIDAIFED